MPYSITTRDGITLNNIPDDVPPDSPQLKARVQQIRAGAGGLEKPVREPIDVEAAGAEAAARHWQEMSGPEQVFQGVGSAFGDILQGIGQKFGVVSDADVERARRQTKALRESGYGIGGNILGNALLAAPTAVIPGANTVLGSAAAGALYGGLQPTTAEESSIGNAAVGGAASGVLTGAMRLGPMLWNTLGAPFTKRGQERIATETAKQFIGDQPLRITQSNVPGVKRTLAESTNNVGAAQLERAAAANSQEVARRIADQDIANNMARVGAIDKLAGSERDRALAVGVREWLSEPLYKQAFQEGVNKGMAGAVRPQVESLLRRRSIQKAVSKAKDIFGESDVDTALQDYGSVKGLQMIKQALDDMIEKAGSPASSIGKTELRALQQTRGDLISTMNDIVPKLRKADRIFANFSEPINRMDVGQTLLNKLRPALGDIGPTNRVTPNSYATAVRDLDGIIKDATGRGLPVEKVLRTDQLQTIRDVGEDFARRAFAQEAGRVPGSPTAQYMTGGKVMRSIMGPLGLPESWADSALAQTLGGRALSAIGKPIERRAEQVLSDLITNPDYAQMLLTRQPSRAGLALDTASRYMLPPASVAGGLLYLPQQQ